MVTAVLTASTVLFATLWLAARARWRRHRVKIAGSPIPCVTIDQLDSRFVLSSTGPAPSTTVAHIANVDVKGGISDLESWILCNLAKDAQRIFEFGTATGKTTYLLAKNARSDAEVVTITLRPDQIGEAVHERGDDAALKAAAQRESAFERFVYTAAPEEQRVRQLYGDSKAFDDAPYASTMDLIFVDGAHTESYVRSDTSKAMRMLKPGGWLLWHDYRGRRVRGVWRTLNALSRELTLVRIKGTSLVAYRKPLS